MKYKAQYNKKLYMEIRISFSMWEMDQLYHINCTFSTKKIAAFPKVEIHLVVKTEKKSPEQSEDQNTYEEN